jgi:hypothetical protein
MVVATTPVERDAYAAAPIQAVLRKLQQLDDAPSTSGTVQQTQCLTAMLPLALRRLRAEYCRLGVPAAVPGRVLG